MDEEFLRAHVHHPDGTFETFDGPGAGDDARSHAGAGDRIELCRPTGLNPVWIAVSVSELPPAFGDLDYQLEPPRTPPSACV